MHIAICQINPIIGDFEYNISLMTEGLKNAKKKGASLVIFCLGVIMVIVYSLGL